ncbi:uncharacterized protein LOC121761453 [Salvia splendens]|uniref:uncharacterized protein LOC121761453 n=1 Tax=Salvia splendens TaxID=180675 RepID=UPI001C2563A2|nr:uncharacterized protein LOC121761453 [Salvia splendens]
MELLKPSFLCILLLLLLLFFGPGFSAGRMHAKNMGSEVYDIDYRGPETHTYNPPPNRAGPRIPHQARHKSKRNACFFRQCGGGDYMTLAHGLHHPKSSTLNQTIY